MLLEFSWCFLSWVHTTQYVVSVRVFSLRSILKLTMNKCKWIHFVDASYWYKITDKYSNLSIDLFNNSKKSTDFQAYFRFLRILQILQIMQTFFLQTKFYASLYRVNPALLAKKYFPWLIKKHYISSSCNTTIALQKHVRTAQLRLNLHDRESIININYQ